MWLFSNNFILQNSTLFTKIGGRPDWVCKPFFTNRGLDLCESLLLGRGIGEAKSEVEYLKPVKEKVLQYGKFIPTVMDWFMENFGKCQFEVSSGAIRSVFARCSSHRSHSRSLLVFKNFGVQILYIHYGILELPHELIIILLLLLFLWSPCMRTSVSLSSVRFC